MLKDSDAVCNIHTGSSNGFFREGDAEWDEADPETRDDEYYDEGGVHDATTDDYGGNDFEEPPSDDGNVYDESETEPEESFGGIVDNSR